MWYTYPAGKTLVHIKVNLFLVLVLLFVVFKKGFLCVSLTGPYYVDQDSQDYKDL